MRLEQTSDASAEGSGNWVGRATAAIGDGRRDGVRERSERARAELGRLAFDALEDYFPEQAKARRGRDASTAFVAGIVLGILLRHLVGR